MATTRTRGSSTSGPPPKGRKRRKKRNIWLVRLQQILVCFFLVFLVVTIGFVVAVARIVKEMPKSTVEIENYLPAGETLIYSSDGTVLASLFVENRQTVTIDHVPQNLQNATVAIEDSRFYTNKYGVDFRGIMRALFHNLRSGEETGGSTITQQLVRNLGIDGIGHEKTLQRKLREAVYAFNIDRNYSKQQILEMYLNQVYYGSGAYGVEKASETYFGKPVGKLDLAQCALIAGLVQRPSALSPYVDKAASVTRRNIVLDRMQQLGYIDASQCSDAEAEPVVLAFPKAPSAGSRTYHANYFVDYVIKQLTDKYGPDTLYRGGLRITTTLNWQMQQAAEKAVHDGISNAGYLGATDAALVAMEPQTGYIKAMVGGVDYEKSQFNIAAYGRRQPGSSFKPIIYTAALDSGLINERTMISDSRLVLPGANGGTWIPKNDDDRYGRPVTAIDAVAMSINVPAVRLLRQVGVDTAIHYASIMGIKSPLQPYLTLALGASAVTPLEMCRMYSLIANQGILPTPIAVEKIVQSDGTLLEEDQPELETTSISVNAMKQMGDMLRAVVTYGTASRVFADGNPPDAHGKTGTTQNNTDVWFDGYTPKLACVVWAGHPTKDPKTGRPAYVPMNGMAFGATICAPIWKQFMVASNSIIAAQTAKEAAKAKAAASASAKTASSTPLSANPPAKTTSVSAISIIPRSTDSTKPIDNSDPAAQLSSDGKNVTVWVDDATGLRATPNAPGAHQETFVIGTEPTTYADGSQVDSTVTTPPITKPVLSTQSPQTTTGRDNNIVAPSGPPPGHTIPPSVGGQNLAAPKMVTVSICVESGMRATEWCPETIQKQFPANQIPKYCTLHKPPPGE
jgi:1A family penicillin-binding protein